MSPPTDRKGSTIKRLINWVDTNLSAIKAVSGWVALLLLIIAIFLQEWLRNLILQYWLVIPIVVALGIRFYNQSQPPDTGKGTKDESNPETQTDGDFVSIRNPSVLLLGVYLLLAMAFCLTIVVQIGTEQVIPQVEGPSNPIPEQTAVPTENTGGESNLSPSTESTQQSDAEPAPPLTSPLPNNQSNTAYLISVLGNNIELTPESRLLLLVVFSGALGGLLKGIQSYRWYLGENKFSWRWIPFYYTEPFVGGGLSLLFYVLIRGGFFVSQTVDSTNIFGLAATSGLIGLFNNQAMGKLKQLADTIFTRQEGGDSLPKKTETTANNSTSQETKSTGSS